MTIRNSRKSVCLQRNLRPLLREQAADEDVIDLSNVAMSHYRLSKIRQQDIQLKANSTEQ